MQDSQDSKYYSSLQKDVEKPIYKLSDQLWTIMTMTSSGHLPGYSGLIAALQLNPGASFPVPDQTCAHTIG